MKSSSQMNEIQFLSWNQLRRMAPSILRLEMSRLDGIVRDLAGDAEFHNCLVMARFALGRFIACLEQTDKGGVEKACAPHLRAAIMNVSLGSKHPDPRVREQCGYVVDRLNYVYSRIRLIY